MVRILQQPRGFADAVSLRHYRPGRTYDIDKTIADYLVLEGYGQFEMRRGQRSARNRYERRKLADGADFGWLTT